MSTTWTSIITDDSSTINHDPIIDNGDDDNTGSGGTTIINAFDGIMNTNEPLFFGTGEEHSIMHNGTSGSLDFNSLNSEGLSNTDSLFNFKDGSDDLLKIHKGGAIAIKNLNETPSTVDTNAYEEGAIIMVNGVLKVKNNT